MPNYLQIPGSKTHELPPLLVQHSDAEVGDWNGVNLMLEEAEDMLAVNGENESILEQRKYDLAVQLANGYKNMLSHWHWGDSVLEWIRQCETTFEAEEALRNFLHPDIWPHAGRASFVTLLAEKQVPASGILLYSAVGLRLTFRQPPPIDCFSNLFLMHLNSSVADTAYQTWARQLPGEPALFPPERFHFEVVDMD